MEQNKTIEKDFRRWVLFNNALSDFNNLYDLYNAVDLKRNTGAITFSSTSTEEGVTYSIDQNDFNSTLELTGEQNRLQFLDYLKEHYFPNQDINEWYKNKVGEIDKVNNHQTLNGISKRAKLIDEIKQHPKEEVYYRLRVFFSAAFYTLIAGIIAFQFWESTTSGVASLVAFLVVFLFVWTVKKVFTGLFIGIVKGSSVKITESQYPDIYKIVEQQSKEIGLKETPEVYIRYGYFNAFVTKFARKKYLLLFSEMVETSLKGDFDVLKFVIGHELCHLKRRHLNKESWLIPSNFIPFLRQAHSRACEYTCDRYGYHFSEKGAEEGILMMVSGTEVYSKINSQKFVDDLVDESSFWIWLSEKFLTHPHPFKRLKAVRDYDKRGY